ncbi:MAG: sensor histidine kinase [Bacteroidia bacterium]|nr:sensor histidine kinase [Bacteroidia bacterium]
MKRSVIVFIHIGYWLLYFFLLFLMSLFMALSSGNGKDLFAKIDIFNFVSHIFALAVVPAAIGFYSFYLYLFPNFLRKKKIALLFLAGIFISLLTGIFGVLVMHVAFRDFNIFQADSFGIFIMIFVMAVIAILNGGMGLILRGFITSYEDIKIKEELKRKNLEVELSLIKSQLSPHFLFNTLNNIDVLIRREPDRASLYLMELSDIMRYMLYEAKKGKIFFEKEIQYIKKYIDLQKIRTSNKDFVTLELTGTFTGILVEPMLLMPFIENAFKHAENKREGNVIEIKISSDEKQIEFSCKNRYLPDTGMKDEFSGLGNELIKKRMNLLFPGRHKLVISDEDEIFQIMLMIDLNEN